MKKVLFLATFLLSMIATRVDATWVLVPVNAKQLPGAFGSLWSTELRVLNSSDSTVTLYLEPCVALYCLEYDVLGRSERALDFYRDAAGPVFLAVDSASLSHLTFQLRVFDESRSNLNWGTYVPVVEWEKVKGERFWFVRVPAASPFRHTVRLYAFSSTPVTARVRYYNPDTNAMLAERSVLVNQQQIGYAQIDSVHVPELQGVDRVRIEAFTESGEKSIWAMVSVTNDETQVVTILPGEATPR